MRSSWGGRFETYVRNNVLATQCLLEAAKRHPRKRFVLASSSSVYGNAETLPTPESATPRPFSPYGMTRLAAEHLCDHYHGNYGVDTVALRYFSVYGPRQRPDMAFSKFCRAAIAGTPVTVYGDGRQTRDFTFVADVVRATRAAAEAAHASGRVYNIGGGAQVSLAQALALIEGYAAGRSRSSTSPASAATCATPAPTPRGRAPSWASRPPCRSRTACVRSSSGRWTQRAPASSRAPNHEVPRVR